MDSNIICERCNLFTNLPENFSCNHSLCSQCVLRIIAFDNIKSIVTQGDIQIACPCTLGTKNYTITDIPKLFTTADAQSSCTCGGKTKEMYCMKCKHFLCDSCITWHRRTQFSHQFIRTFTKCKLHEGKINGHYCSDCQKSICSECTLSYMHLSHNFQLIQEFSNLLRDNYNFLDQVKRIEKIRGDFKTQVDDTIKKTMKRMDELVQLIEVSKGIYSNQMSQTLERADLLLNLLEFCYLDINQSEAIEDFLKLKDLNTWNIGNFELQDEVDKMINKFQEDFKECLKCEPVSAINFDWSGQPNWIIMPTQTIIGHNYAIYSLIQLKDGRIASSSTDNTFKVWELIGKTFRNTVTLFESNAPVWPLIQMEDGRIVSGSNNTTIKVWVEKDQTFMNTLILSGHNKIINSLNIKKTFSEGKQLNILANIRGKSAII